MLFTIYYQLSRALEELRRPLDAAQTMYFTIYYSLSWALEELERPLDAAQTVYFTILSRAPITGPTLQELQYVSRAMVARKKVHGKNRCANAVMIPQSFWILEEFWRPLDAAPTMYFTLYY